jgi:hypothetical protein
MESMLAPAPLIGTGSDAQNVLERSHRRDPQPQAMQRPINLWLRMNGPPKGGHGW